MIVKGFAPWILFDGFEEKFLYPLECRELPIAIRVLLRMGSSFHGGERKGQLGPDVTVPMSGLPPEGYPEGSRRVWTPQNVYIIWTRM